FREHAAYLASDTLQGRRVGSDGSAKAADYIARQLQAGRLLPLGDGGTCFQAFTPDDGVRARNVLAACPGAGSLADQCVIVAAHYDHLGSRPDSDERGTSGDRIFNGADDNASGVAALLLIAQALALDRDRLPSSRRAVIFAAFDAEEMGLKGAQYYAE